jgi:hypothetical protein
MSGNKARRPSGRTGFHVVSPEIIVSGYQAAGTHDFPASLKIRPNGLFTVVAVDIDSIEQSVSENFTKVRGRCAMMRTSPQSANRLTTFW